MNASKKQHLGELIRYGICGGITTGINFGIFCLLIECNVYYIFANVTAYYISVIINFFFNRKLVFSEKKEKKGTKMFLEFLYLRTLSLFVDTCLFYLLVSILQLNVYISRIGLSGAIIIINYVVSKKRIFR